MTSTPTALAALALGWVEDVAARRPPRCSPFVKRLRQPPVAAQVPATMTV